MSQTAAQQLTKALVAKQAEIASTKQTLAIQTQQLAVSRAELVAQAKKVDEATQSLLAYKATLTDPAQKAAIDQSIAALQPKLIALQNQTSGLQSAVNFTRSTLNTQQTAATNIQTQITTEEKSASQTGPVPTDTATNTGNTAVNTTSTEIPELITDPELISYVEPSNSSQATMYPIRPPTLDEYTEPSLISPYSAPIVPTVAPQEIDQYTEPSNSSPFNQSATGNGLSVASILRATGPAGFSTQGLLQQTRPDAVKAAAVSQATQSDWRVRLHLARDANYLYKDPAIDPTKTPGLTDIGILYPLIATDGVIFPYTPDIQVQYVATYPDEAIVHSNYKIFQYKGSSVDQVTITCDFTAQDNSEANYILAVIHFFRSLTKMFYGKDQNPNPGVPPPLCYLTGLGQFQFNNHALVVSGFTYSLPTDVDYIRAGSPTTLSGTNLSAYTAKAGSTTDSAKARINANGVPVGGRPAAPMFIRQATYLSNSNVTYVPTKMKMTITCLPVVSRNQVSTEFSLKEYATGKLLKRGFW